MAKTRRSNTQPLWRLLFVLYCGVMLWLLFGRSFGWDDGIPYVQQLKQNINLTPLLTIRNYASVVQQGPEHPLFVHCMINLAGNVGLFIPAGWLLPKLFRPQRNFFLFLLTCALSILLVESVQLLSLLGSFDVDDIILNLSGMVLGCLAYQIGIGKPRKP